MGESCPDKQELQGRLIDILHRISGAEPAVIAGNLKLIIAELKAADSEMPIVLCNVFPSHESKKRPAEKIKEINKLYAAAVKGDSLPSTQQPSVAVGAPG